MQTPSGGNRQSQAFRFAQSSSELQETIYPCRRLLRVQVVSLCHGIGQKSSFLSPSLLHLANRFPAFGVQLLQKHWVVHKELVSCHYAWQRITFLHHPQAELCKYPGSCRLTNRHKLWTVVQNDTSLGFFGSVPVKCILLLTSFVVSSIIVI